VSQHTAIFLALIAGLTGLTVRADETSHDFGRYQIIDDRAPFGALIGSADTAPQPSFSANYSFVGTAKLDETQPLLAIIQDKAGNRTFFKAEGETIGDVTVIKIEKTDKAQVKLVLKQGLEVATLSLETKTSVGAAPPAPAGQPQPAMPGLPPGPASAQPGVRRIPFRRGG
jgi:hypothetical protein